MVGRRAASAVERDMGHGELAIPAPECSSNWALG
jgi:hypothetical protein